jgi:hypothetical protein
MHGDLMGAGWLARGSKAKKASIFAVPTRTLAGAARAELESA